MDVYLYSDITDHSLSLLQGLDKMRIFNPQLCDYNLVTSNGEKFPCHRSVLCLFSNFFRATIDGGWKESFDNECEINVSDCKTLKRL